LKIRDESAGKYSLDDVMRAFWNKYGVTNIGVPEDGFERLTAEVTGLNLHSFFQSYVRGTEDPPLDEQLARQGINLELRQMKNPADLGGFTTSSCQNESLLTLGVKFLTGVSEAKIQQVFDGGAAQQAGISAGDELVAVDGIKCTAKNIDALVAVDSTEVPLEIHLFRRDELLLIQVQLKIAPADTCDLIYTTDSTSEMINNRCSWLQLDE
jgi:predicted metalloprotease with PDZ domain